MGYKFSERSRSKLQTCEYDLRIIMNAAIAVSDIDFGISEGLRTDEKQLEYYLSDPPKTFLDPRNTEHRKKARHLANNRGLSEAVDIFAWVEGRKDLMYDREHLSHIAATIITTAKVLYNAGKVAHLIRWGGNWDMDGCILQDQKFDDLPHFELYKP